MTNRQVRAAYQDKEDTPCPITERLIKEGYQQKYTRNSYIGYAVEQNLEVTYEKALPTQWWHLIRSYCDRSEDTALFTRRIRCGELYIWMAEVLDCVDKDELNSLVDRIIESRTPVRRRQTAGQIPKPPYVYQRAKWNREIIALCFDRIAGKVEELYPIFC